MRMRDGVCSMRSDMRAARLLLEHHAVHPSFLLEVGARPVDGVDRRLEELAIRVLLADVLLVEVELDELLDKHRVPGAQVLLREPGVEHEPVVLRNMNMSVTCDTRWTKQGQSAARETFPRGMVTMRERR